MVAARFGLALALALILAGAAASARAGTMDAPELSDAAGDCSVLWGNAYLDLVSAWISDETATDFRVSLALASFDDAIAEGAGYTVQFEHQGVAWGVIATYRPLSAEGWDWFTGHAQSSGSLDLESMERTSGAFDPATATLTWTFPKSLFPHADANDNALVRFWAGTADLRPAYPLLLAGETAGDAANGRWIVCDEARADESAYSFSSGHHAHAPQDAQAAPPVNATPGPADATAGRDAPEEPASDARAETPSFGGAALLALALAAFPRGRRDRS